MFKAIARFPKFLKEVKEELKKVNWSSRQDLAAAAVIVIITVGLLTTYIYVVDLGLSRLMQTLLQ